MDTSPSIEKSFIRKYLDRITRAWLLMIMIGKKGDYFQFFGYPIFNPILFFFDGMARCWTKDRPQQRLITRNYYSIAYYLSSDCGASHDTPRKAHLARVDRALDTKGRRYWESIVSWRPWGVSYDHQDSFSSSTIIHWYDDSCLSFFFPL